MDEPKKSRLWLPRFSLRVLLILVTLFALFVAYQARWIKQRRDYLKEHPAAIVTWQKKEPVSAPMLLGIWGESGQSQLQVEVSNFGQQSAFHKTNAGPEADELRRLFPEAIITVRQGITIWHTWMPGHKWEWGKRLNKYEAE